MTYRRRLIALIPLLPLTFFVGCEGGSGSTLDASPANWSEYAGRDVTLRGSAGNSGQGPIVRFDDGGYVGILSRQPWAIDAVGKPVEVSGRVVSGQGVRAEPYVIDVKFLRLIPPEEQEQKTRKVAR